MFLLCSFWNPNLMMSMTTTTNCTPEYDRSSCFLFWIYSVCICIMICSNTLPNCFSSLRLTSYNTFLIYQNPLYLLDISVPFALIQLCHCVANPGNKFLVWFVPEKTILIGIYAICFCTNLSSSFFDRIGKCRMLILGFLCNTKQVNTKQVTFVTGRSDLRTSRFW